jgi:Mannosyltransferase (PIG-V)
MRRGIGEDLRRVLPAWVTARVLVAAGYVAAVAISNRLLHHHPEQLNNGLVAWDGTWYRDIAAHGYHLDGVASVRFFPLFPLIGRLLAVPIGGRVSVTLVLVANVASLIAVVLARRLVLAEKGDAELADRAVWCIVLFPAAFVLVLAYAEAIMLVATIGAFLALRRGRWWIVAGLGLVAGLSRPIGVLLVVPVLIEACIGFGRARLDERLARVAAVAAPVVGLVAYLGWVGHVYGNWRLPFTVQDDLRGKLILPPSRILEGFRQMFGTQRFDHGLHIPFLIVLLVLVVFTFRYWPLSYGCYAAAIVLLAMSAQNLNSLERYGMSAFPLLLTLAVLVRPPQVERTAFAIMGGGMVALSSMAWLGAYVP